MLADDSGNCTILAGIQLPSRGKEDWGIHLLGNEEVAEGHDDAPPSSRIAVDKDCSAAAVSPMYPLDCLYDRWEAWGRVVWNRHVLVVHASRFKVSLQKRRSIVRVNRRLIVAARVSSGSRRRKSIGGGLHARCEAPMPR